MNQLLKKILLLLLIADLSFSFYQHYHKPLDGDMSEIILPTPEKGYFHVLHDPFGLNALLHGQRYANPNRFFAHWSSATYFLNMPLLLQKFTNPINSVYLSVALAKTLIQALILYLLAVFISNKPKIYTLDFLMAAVLIAPLFQTADYSRYLGIIDQSVIYTFFYALPLGLLLLFYLPFYRLLYFDKKLKFSPIQHVLMVGFMVVLTLNGPLVPGVVLIVCPLVLLDLWMRYIRQSKQSSWWVRARESVRKIPAIVLFYFISIGLLSLYSLFLGGMNALNSSDSISLLERYSRIPAGIYFLVSQKLGYPLMLLLIIINIVLIKRYYQSKSGAQLLTFIGWFGLFTLLYILLLPLGGYRVYRENIIRYDTIMPITMGCMFIFGATAFYLIKHLSGMRKSIYVTGIISLLLIFTVADMPDTEDYQCERKALETIAQSTDSIVTLYSNCPVMEWTTINDYHTSELNADLFYYWHITSEKKMYFHYYPQVSK